MIDSLIDQLTVHSFVWFIDEHLANPTRNRVKPGKEDANTRSIKQPLSCRITYKSQSRMAVPPALGRKVSPVSKITGTREDECKESATLAFLR